MITIYHNPRCRKSREGLAFLNDNGLEYEEIRYLENPLDRKTLKSVLEKLGIKPMDLVRTSEAIWKENYKGKELTNDEVIDAMLQFPKLIERPIVVQGVKAVIARPAERIQEIL